MLKIPMKIPMKIPKNKAIVQTSSRRILLSIDAVSYSPEVIDLAVEMAALLGLQLHGLFVEDIDLLSVAGQSFTTEITLATADERVLDPDSMLRSFRAISSKIRAQLEQAARLASVQWSFETTRGRRVETGLASCQDTDDLVIIGQQIRSTSHFPKTLFASQHKRLLLIDDKAPAIQTAIDMILRLSKKTEIDLALLTSDQASATLSKLKPSKDSSHLASIRRIPFEKETLERLLQNSIKPFDYVIVTQNQPSELLQKILNKSICPVIVVA